MNYQRELAVQYANQYWNQPNPGFVTFHVDCTNFVSQCLYAGTLPMDYTMKRDSGWWYKGYVQGKEWWSYSWAVAHALQLYLLQSGRGIAVQSARELELGDVISYDWNGDGRYQHSTIVTAHNSNQEPLVNAHTYSASHEYWAYEQSPEMSVRTKYVFIHINST